jgi:hypothetical protein
MRHKHFGKLRPFARRGSPEPYELRAPRAPYLRPRQQPPGGGLAEAALQAGFDELTHVAKEFHVQAEWSPAQTWSCSELRIFTCAGGRDHPVR